jgi:hypothetical protein
MRHAQALPTPSPDLPPGLQVSPIAASAGRGRRWAAALPLTLVAGGFLGWGGLELNWKLSSPGAVLVDQLQRLPSLVLDYPPDKRSGSRDTPELKGPGNTKDPRPGEGSKYGNGAVDPSFMKVAMPSDDLGAVPYMGDASELKDIPPLPTAPIRLAARKDLPVVPGGNGAARGTGRSLGSGGGGTRRYAWDLKNFDDPDYTLQVIYAVDAHCTFTGVKDNQVAVQVLVRINHEGIPISAKAFAGIPDFFKPCIEAAMQWRFRVPMNMQDGRPIYHIISFLPRKA